MRNADGIRAYLSIGSNIEPRAEYLQRAADLVAATDGVTLLRVSSVYETEPWGNENQQSFLNAVLDCATTLEPHELLEVLKGIESACGRVSLERFGPREVDLDILLYGSLELNESGLTIPHPRMHLRRFALVPLCELAPDAGHPRSGARIGEMLATCPDMGRVWKSEYKIALHAK